MEGAEQKDFKENTFTMKNRFRALSVILPDNTELSMTVGFEDRGQDVLKQLCEFLDSSRLPLFGLSVVKDDQPLFLDLEQKLSLYLPKSWRKNTSKERVTLSLKVQYFIKNVEVILDSEARKLYYAELKGKVLRSECFEQEGLYFQLAAYGLQADLGDYKEHNFAYFSAQGFFPFWIVQKHGNDYILKHTPALHRELKGMSSSEAALLFIQESFTLSDVPLTIYRLTKEKNKRQGCVLIGVASTGLQISEGRKFEIRADGLHEKKLVLYSLSVLHAKNLLKHISSSHQLHLSMKPLVTRLRGKKGRHREMYITDGADLNTYDSDDELPPMKLLLDRVQKQTTGSSECRNVTGSDASNGFCCLEMSVDEPEEMSVDDPEDVLRLIELVEGVSVDGPLFLPISH
ncbi:FERM domain-containing protein 1 isoform X2 [Puntigrus tetrazona]|uniref:FERM domain-containing protein 1 isoform X2 n=1 Tax=Puntigrus tetrazona TaxID=1606681 RepID=UPI001C89FFA6|nr:FERM domain-containing protein 1 isoform X2 [Puntigrus tetrazona]